MKPIRPLLKTLTLKPNYAFLHVGPCCVVLCSYSEWMCCRLLYKLSVVYCSVEGVVCTLRRELLLCRCSRSLQLFSWRCSRSCSMRRCFLCSWRSSYSRFRAGAALSTLQPPLESTHTPHRPRELASYRRQHTATHYHTQSPAHWLTAVYMFIFYSSLCLPFSLRSLCPPVCCPIHPPTQFIPVSLSSQLFTCQSPMSACQAAPLFYLPVCPLTYLSVHSSIILSI